MSVQAVHQAIRSALFVKPAPCRVSLASLRAVFGAPLSANTAYQAILHVLEEFPTLIATDTAYSPEGEAFWFIINPNLITTNLLD